MIKILLLCVTLAATQSPYYPTPAGLDTTKLLMPSNFIYLGAFSLPTGTYGSSDGFTYLNGGMGYYDLGDPTETADGFPGSLFIISNINDGNKVAQVSIPVPVISKTYSGLPVASCIANFKSYGATAANPGVSIADILTLPPQGNQTGYMAYFTGGDAYTALPANENIFTTSTITGTNQIGPRAIGTDASDCYGAYMAAVPLDWSQTYAPGMRIIQGRERQGLNCGAGPAAYLMDPWNDPATGNLTGKPVLRYGQNSDSTIENYNSGGDQFRAAAWPEVGSKSAFILMGLKGLGQSMYGVDPCSGYKGFYASGGYDPIVAFYNPGDLAKTYAGTFGKSVPQPYTSFSLSQYFIHKAAVACDENPAIGAGWDAAHGYLYVLEDGQDQPVVHVFKINSSAAGASSPVSSINAATAISHFSVSPFVSNGKLSISGVGKISTLDIYDVQGLKIFHSENFLPNNSPLNISSHPKGRYLVKIKSEGQNYTQKIIIQ